MCQLLCPDPPHPVSFALPLPGHSSFFETPAAGSMALHRLRRNSCPMTAWTHKQSWRELPGMHACVCARV